MGTCQCKCHKTDPRHQDGKLENSPVVADGSAEEEICDRQCIVEALPVCDEEQPHGDALKSEEAEAHALPEEKLRGSVHSSLPELEDDDLLGPLKSNDSEWHNSASWFVMDIVQSLRSISNLPVVAPDHDYKPAGMRPRKPSSNQNQPCHYEWLQDILFKLSRNETNDLGCGDADTSEDLLPLFFVMGACPNVLCGMQVVVYCRSITGRVDFWWVKPAKASAASGDAGRFAKVERETLRRHGKGPYKNDPGRSLAVYKPLAVLFEKASMASGWRFGIEEVYCEHDGSKVPRAYMQRVSPGLGEDDKKLYVYLFWQEDWTMNPFARQKYVKGKMVYQKKLTEQPPLFFSRQYEIVNDNFSIQNFEEPPFCSYLPPETLKTLWEPDGDASRASTT